MKFLNLADAEKRIEELESKIKDNYIAIIKRYGDKYTQEELEKEDLESLETIIDAVRRFMPSDERAEVIPITPYRDEKKPDHTVIKRIDFSRVFEDVAKEFNMSNLKVKK